MITSKAIPICRSPFQGKSMLCMSSSSSPRSVGAGSYNSSPRWKMGYGMVTMAYDAVGDQHNVLGIVPEASKYKIKKAYQRLALQYHPDVCEGNHCTTNFQQINPAYEMLLNATTSQFGEFEDDLLTIWRGLRAWATTHGRSGRSGWVRRRRHPRLLQPHQLCHIALDPCTSTNSSKHRHHYLVCT